MGHNEKMAESNNGASWTAITSSHFSQKVGNNDDDQIRAIAYGGGMFMAGGNRYEYPYSDNTTYREQPGAKMAYGY